MNKKDKFQTRAIHIGNKPDKETGAVSPPIHLTSTFEQESVGNDSLDYAASESGCSGCHNAQNISVWLVLALIVIPLKRRFYGLSHARISRS